MILNRVRRYYHDNIEVLREKARNIKNYQMMKGIKKDSMEDIGIIRSLKKLDKKGKNMFFYNIKNDARTSF